MMQQSSRKLQHPAEEIPYITHPKRFDVFLHAGKTAKLLGALLTDRRIPALRKFVFLGSVGALAVLLFFPDLLNEAFLSTVLPLVGTVLGIPIDAGFDWAAFALVAVGLLRFFPAEIVSEHYENIFHRRRNEY